MIYLSLLLNALANSTQDPVDLVRLLLSGMWELVARGTGTPELFVPPALVVTNEASQSSVLDERVQEGQGVPSGCKDCVRDL